MKGPLVRAAAVLAIFALPTAATAQALKFACIPKDEAAAIVSFALPTMVERLAERCRPALPPGAYLSTYAGQLADRYRPDADAAWPAARRTIARMFGQLLGQPMPAEMNGDMIRTLAAPGLASLLTEKVKTRDCAAASEALQSLSTVSGRDIGRLAAIGALLADRKGEGIAGVLKICRPDDDK